MENKKILFITYDTSGYYTAVYDELRRSYALVEFYNTAKISYKYSNILVRAYSFFYKVFTRNKLKNYLRYQKVIDDLQSNHYDVTLMVRPDLFFDSQLKILRKASDKFVAYYHDSVNEIPRKDKVIHFFDKVYSYEKRDVKDFKLDFLSNFIYREETPQKPEYAAFTVMSSDYRIEALHAIAAFFLKHNHSAKFFVSGKKRSGEDYPNITYIEGRLNLEQVADEIRKTQILVDIHKYGVQDGLTFRVFEAMGFGKKLITTNADIRNYDFYNPNNIFVIDDIRKVDIPNAFFQTPYAEIPAEIYRKYTVAGWLDKIMA